MESGQEAAIDVGGLWKIFGQDPDAARSLAEAGADREEIQQATGSVVAVRDVSFDAHVGETFVVMGLSGSGKSTLVRLLARLIEPTAGTVEVCGEDVLALERDQLRQFRRTKVSMVFQHFGLFPHRTVVDNVAYGLEVRGMARAARRERAMELLDVVGLQGWDGHYPQQLSGGMQQRVGLARALAVDPEVLFFDEPFSALDPLIRRDMQDELLALQAGLRRTLIFISHDFDEALRLADRIAIMRDGEFVQVGTPAEILTDPADDYVEAFTRDAPKQKVLTAADAMRPLGSELRPPAAISIAASTTLEELIPRLLASPDALLVADDQEQPLGLVASEDVAHLLSPSSPRRTR